MSHQIDPEPLPAPAGPDVIATACGPDCNRREVVDIHLATPYGVSSHLLVPVARRALGAAHGSCALAFDATAGLQLTFTAAKVAGTRTEVARVDEFFAGSDALVIRAPAVFIPPPKAALRMLLRDESTGATAATLSFDGLTFDVRQSCYVIAGADLRNFVGDTSRPATDKTLRGALKPYLDHLLAQGRLADDGESIPFTLSAALVAEGQEVAVGGTIPVQVTRRGKTIVEPKPEPAAE